jgi:hypothetical protein
MNMYRLLRDTHLLTGLFCGLFVLAYGMSAAQMAHSRWFSLKPQVTAQTFSIPAGLDARAAARELMDRGLAGDLRDVAGTKFRIVRPGTVYDVRYDPAAGTAEVKTSRAGFWGILNRLHHARGLWHDYRPMNVWGGFVVLISAAMFVLGATGVYLWFQMYNERKIGLAIIVGSLAWSLTAAWLIRAA